MKNILGAIRVIGLLAAVIWLAATNANAGFRDERSKAPAEVKASAVEAKKPGADVGEKAPGAGVAAVEVPAAPPKPTWSLSSSKTLRDNLDDWVRTAGWHPIIWDASNHYQVRLNTSSIEGDFPDVLKQISAATGLNICAKRRDKYVRVTDRGVSCKEMNQ